MERNLDRKTLSFGKGMTNVPSDLLSDDTELAYCRDFIYKDGEMKPVQKMVNVGSIGGKVMHVHKMADFENFIAYDEFVENGTITWYRRNDLTKAAGTFSNIGKVTDIKSVGNTLVATTEKGLHYLLYKEGDYKDLGTELPIPHFYPQFLGTDVVDGGTTPCNLEEIIDCKTMKAAYDKRGGVTIVDPNFSESVTGSYSKYYQYSQKPKDAEKQQTYQDAVQGHVASIINVLKERNFFLFPFFIRYALRLFDGSYARISNPIACFPTISKNCKFVPAKWGEDDNGIGLVETSEDTRYFLYHPHCAKLWFKASIENIANWKDIVKELVVFASDDVMTFNLQDKWDFKRASEVQGEYYYDYLGYKQTSGGGLIPTTITEPAFYFTEDKYPARDVIMPRYKTDQEIIDELTSKSQFFKLFDIDCNSSYLGSLNFVEAPIRKSVVANLTSQSQLKVDDYYGWAHLTATKEYSYNNRINMIGVKRFPFMGFSNFVDTGIFSTELSDITYYVHIVSESIDAWVKSNKDSIGFLEVLDSWFYYPDPNATEAIIWNEKDNKGMKIQLKAHSMLNGAYCFNHLPKDNNFASNVTERPTINENAHETLNSQIFTSVVNNPFVFEASGDNTIGTGSILGIVANTDAISQGQFGQYPLLVFTDEGIYAMGVNSEGLYSNIYPISREVCNNADSITPTDKLIFFTSEKGLMATTGGQVVCVSNALSGGKNRLLPEIILPFKKFLENCLIAYDYKESLLRIFNTGTNYHYVYNMIDKTFSTASNYVGGRISCRNIVNNYPDNMVQFTDSAVYSLTSIPQREDDKYEYEGLLNTRPLKLGGSSILKSIRSMKHLFDSDDGTITVSLFGSNDCKTWQRINSMMGKPWKYFRMEYEIKKFLATDSFAGSIVEVQPRREDKIR